MSDDQTFRTRPITDEDAQEITDAAEVAKRIYADVLRQKAEEELATGAPAQEEQTDE